MSSCFDVKSYKILKYIDRSIFADVWINTSIEVSGQEIDLTCISVVEVTVVALFLRLSDSILVLFHGMVLFVYFILFCLLFGYETVF